jgi:hypothetical protein
LDHVDGPTPSLLHLDLLLRGAAQRTRCIGLGPQTLDGCRYLPLIRSDGRSDRGIVVDILRHHLDHVGKAHQRDECRIKPLLLGGGGQLRYRKVLVLPQPVGHIQNFLRVGGSSRDLR